MPETPAPEKPLLLYDGTCGFCKIWIEYSKALTAGAVDYAASQEAGARFPNISSAQFARSVQLAMPGGEIRGGAWAAFTTLAYAPGRRWPARAYEALPGFAAVSEAAYALVAAHRNFFYWVTVLLFGKRVRPAAYGRVEWLFSKLLGAVYLMAFLSLAVQVTGLIGERGVLPLGPYLRAARDALGPAAYWRLPSIFWLSHGDATLLGAAIAGCVLAALLLMGVGRGLPLAAMFVLYLSFSSAGQDFFSFQWDALLLEAGFLSLFLGNGPVIIWLFRCLVFRLFFLSGSVKLLSHDPSWRALTALDFHYFTQPLPTPAAWYMQQLPEMFQRFSTASVFAIEIGAPFLIFAPRRLRHWGAAALIFLQTLILATGNYAFFNWLSIALCLFLFDDRALGRWIGRAWPSARRLHRPALAAFAAIMLLLNAGRIQEVFQGAASAPLGPLLRWTAPFDIVNGYGLFAVMTTLRPEIVIEGSNDGLEWRDYEFPYKPGALGRMPPIVAPHQPRLDWQMWFAALGNYENNPWFLGLMKRLLEGSPPVLRLLGRNPFPSAPPRYVRAALFDYRFTDAAMRAKTGRWWTREPRGLYLPAISIESFATRPSPPPDDPPRP